MVRKRKEQKETAWRADFRDPEALPDIKVVRTHFLLNLGVAALLLGVAGYLGLVMYDGAFLAQQMKDLRAQSEQGESADRVFVKQSRDFRDGSARLDELSAFEEGPLDPITLLQELSAVVPEEGRLTSVSLELRERDKQARVYEFTVRGSMLGSEGSDPTILVNRLHQEIASIASIESILISSSVTALSRNENFNSFDYTFLYVLPEKVEQSKGRGS